jgi:predicted nuclease of restriction endonuclease-like (RecB) superfamily
VKPSKNKYNDLLKNIGSTIETGRNNALSALNEQILLTYWEIGWHIVEFEQHGSKRAEYGTALINNLSDDLKLRHGKGFSRSNIKLMRLFYLNYPKFQTSGKNQKGQTSGKFRKNQTSGKLTWSHYSELLGVSDDMARAFYEQQGIKENWSVRELKRQIDSALFQRLALSRDKKAVLALSAKGQRISNTSDLIKDPYVFEFLKIPESKRVTEAALEKKLIDNLQSFLLELGKGFSFIARQFRITLDNRHFRIDLVFYHRILKCFILIDLKTRKVNHGDIGQMNLYLNYFKEEENTEGDREPIGIIIAADKHEYLVKYATGGLSNKIFVSKYQLYLPDKKLLEQKVKEIIEGK